MIIPIILSGGTGSRLWPLSRPAYPKQFLPLTTGSSLLQDTIQRLDQLEDIGSPLLICNEAHRFIAAEQLQAIGAEAQIILEPEGRNTAPAAAIAALWACQHHDNPNLLLLPADHQLTPTSAFTDAVATANRYANDHYHLTFGIQPTAPETGYGYIQAGDVLETGVSTIKQFVEKPDQSTAEHYLRSGNYYWNSGMFVFNARTLLAELTQYQPTLVAHCQTALAQATTDIDFVRLGKTFLQAPDISIDYALMEQTQHAAVIPLTSDWSDVGAWSSLWETLDKNSNNNVTRGDVVTDAVTNSYIHADSRLVAAIGLNDHVIVETDDAVLVTTKAHSQSVKTLVDTLKQQQRTEATNHHKVHRPWGWYKSITQGPRFQVKRIAVTPGASLSLQLHHHRAEHWVVVKGTATVTCGEDTFQLAENQSTYIPVETKHRLVNNTDSLLEIIEVQSGDYLGEDDIVRFDDKYHRKA